MTRLQQLEKALEESFRKYEKLISIVKDNKTSDRIEEIEEDFEDTVTELRELDELPDVDVVVVLNDGVFEDIYSMQGTTYVVMDKAFSNDPYDAKETAILGNYTQFVRDFDKEEVEE